MIRGYAVGLAVATIRPIMGILRDRGKSTARLRSHKNFFGTAFWIGFVAQSILAEIWIRFTRRGGASNSRIEVAA